MPKTTVPAPRATAYVIPSQVDYARLNRGVSALGALSSDYTEKTEEKQRANPSGGLEVILGVLGIGAIIGVGIWYNLPQRRVQEEYANTLSVYRKKLAESKGGEVPPMPPPPTNINISQNRYSSY